MRAVIYARISKEEQSKYSITQQIKLCTEFLEREGHEIVDTFIDDGYSSRTMNRPDLQRMLRLIKTKSFDIICVWNSDRLTRTTLDGLIMVTTMFKPSGIEFASVTEDIDTSTPDGMMMLTIRLSMAQREREKIAERASMGQAARARSGKRNTSARPYGYNVGEDLKLTINEEEAAVVRNIFNWYIGGWGRIKIAMTLNEKGIPANRGGKWPEKIIGDILKNITYTGAVHWKPKGAPESERIIVENVHEAIIPIEMFLMARSIFNRRRENDMSQSSYDFIFSTVAKCALCGRSFHGKMRSASSKRSPYYRYYRCSGKYRPDVQCKTSDVAESKLTDMLFRRIDSIIEGLDEQKPVTKQTVSAEKERKRMEKQLADSKERRKKWARAMGDGVMSYEEYTELVNDENARAARLQEELNALPENEPKQVLLRKDISRQLINLKRDWNGSSHADRKAAIQHLFKRIVIGKVNEEWRILGHEFQS